MYTADHTSILHAVHSSLHTVHIQNLSEWHSRFIWQNEPWCITYFVPSGCKLKKRNIFFTYRKILKEYILPPSETSCRLASSNTNCWTGHSTRGRLKNQGQLATRRSPRWWPALDRQVERSLSVAEISRHGSTRLFEQPLQRPQGSVLTPQEDPTTMETPHAPTSADTAKWRVSHKTSGWLNVPLSTPPPDQNSSKCSSAWVVSRLKITNWATHTSRGGTNSSIFLNIWDTFGPQVFLCDVLYIKNSNILENF